MTIQRLELRCWGWHFLTSILIISCLLAVVAANSQQTDIASLLDLRNSIVNWEQFSAANDIVGWNATSPVCIWTGVTCDARGRVTTVSLSCNSCPVRAIGTLPATLGTLDMVNSLNLESNAFFGQLPTDWGAPNQFPSLINLFLDGNNLTGTIPWQGTVFPQLQLLRLDGNHLSGTLNISLVMPSLQVFRIFNNNLTGNLPADFWTKMFPQLQIFAGQQNEFQQSLPVSWASGDASQLNELYLQQNSLSGGLPSSWGDPKAFPVLRYLTLGSNPYGGQLPEAWGQSNSFPQLRSLQISNASLNGTLPSTWGKSGSFPVIDSIDISMNNLSGPIENWIGLTSLSRLIVQPGNPGLCTYGTTQLPFSLCTSTDVSCLVQIPQLESCTSNQTVPGASSGNSTGNTTSSGASTSSGVSAVAIAVPIAVGVPLVAGIGCFLLLFVRKRRRDRTSEVEDQRDKRDDPREGHPFDTFEGQETMTSPFAGTIFRRGASGQIAPTGSPSATQNTSSDSRDSIASMCARIRTRSFDLPRNDPTRDVQLGTSPPALTGSRVQVVSSPAQLEGSQFLGTTSTIVTQAQSGGKSQTSLQGSAESFVEPERSLSHILPIPFSDWEITPQELEMLKKPDGADWILGSGGFGIVYKALRNGVQPVAVKKLAKSSDPKTVGVDSFKREISILKACRDANIVQFQGAYLGEDETLLVMEYMEGGNLMDNLARGRVTWWRRGRKIAIDIAKGLVFLHSRRIVHFDLKSPNILLTRDGTAKIADVGMAKFLAKNYVTGVVGTLAWAAPEMLWGERCTEKADIYSYGIILWEICTGQAPVRGQLRDVKVPDECPEVVRNLILECLETRPSKRPSALKIIEVLQSTSGGQVSSDGAEKISKPSPPASQQQKVSEGSTRSESAPNG